jgi:hypothetical protein
LNQPDLAMIHRSATLQVEGSRDVQDLALPAGYRLLIGGTVVGWRSASGELLGRESALSMLRSAAPEGLEQVTDSLEGRYFVLLLRPDGSAELAVNAFGQIDIYYQRVGEQCVFATDLSLLPVARGAAGYDQAALAHTLLVHERRPPKRHTLYRDVSRLGVRERVQFGEKAVIAASSFRAMPVRPYGDRELNDYADLLLDAVRVRGSRKGNVVYLSSGWDSTALLACLVALYGAGKVRAVIGRMRYSERSGVINQFEIDRAKAVADHYRVPLDLVEFGYCDEGPALLERLRPLLQANQLSSLVALNHWQLAEHTARTSNGGESVFAGEISDGAHNLGFSQYVTMFHASLEFREYADKMGSYLFGPKFLESFTGGKFSSDPVYNLLRNSAGDAVFDAPRDGHSDRVTQFLASLFLRSTRIPLWSLSNRKLLTPAGRELYASEMEASYLRPVAEAVTSETLYSWYLHLYNSFHWQGSTVTPLWVTAEAHALTMQVPFWDSRLQEFLSCMPENWGRGLDLHPTKYPLKWALKNRIPYPMHLQVGPHSYTYDVVQGFSLAAELLYASSFRGYFRDRLRERRYLEVLSPEVFDLEYLERLTDRYVEGTEVRGGELSDLGALCWFSAIGWYN